MGRGGILDVEVTVGLHGGCYGWLGEFSFAWQ